MEAADKELLNSLKLGMIGFGAQASAEAENLRKSQINFQIGLRPEGPSFKKASEQGFSVSSIQEVVKSSKVLFINIPDQSHGVFFKEFLADCPAEYFVFAHGFSMHFGLIPKSAKQKSVLIAPKGAASGLERLYGTSEALPAILGFEPGDPNESEKFWIEALARALGAHPKGLIWASFKDEAVCDLFSEQALLCGGVSKLLQNSYEVMVEAGYNPETAYFETLFELKLIVDLIWKDGITGMRNKISPTARYGDLTRGGRVIDERVKANMKQVLLEVENGAFAQEFLDRIESPEFQENLSKEAAHPIEMIGKRLRQKMRD